MTATLSIPEEVRDRLKLYGHKGDTYADILERMMDRLNLEDFIRESRRRITLHTPDDWIDDADV